jgi:hypothetical protein
MNSSLAKNGQLTATPVFGAGVHDGTFLRLIERNDTAKNLADQGAALATAAARTFTLWDSLRLCKNRGAGWNMLQDGDWRANASLASCCATIVDGGSGAMLVEALSPFIDLSLPGLKVSKVLQSRADAATYIAEQLINLPIEEKKELIAATTAPAFDAAVGICEAAAR